MSRGSFCLLALRGQISVRPLVRTVAVAVLVASLLGFPHNLLQRFIYNRSKDLFTVFCKDFLTIAAKIFLQFAASDSDGISILIIQTQLYGLLVSRNEMLVGKHRLGVHRVLPTDGILPLA